VSQEEEEDEGERADISDRVLHEDSRVRITLAHLLLSLLESHEHVMRDDYRTESHLLVLRILSAQYQQREERGDDSGERSSGEATGENGRERYLASILTFL
jgi:hypothetical protein